MTANIFLTPRFESKIRYSFLNIIRKNSCEENDIIIEDKKDQGVIILNRPKTLNALNLPMLKKIYPTLQKWEMQKALVLVKGAGDKAFCAGADVKSVVEAGLKGDTCVGVDFFRRQYIMNGLIGSFLIPYIALIDGVVMGSGVGLSVHGQYRVATERTLFAMPGSQIGLFSDVGTSYVLPQLTGQLGIYLALTGHRLEGSDVLKAGIATHYCESKDLEPLEERLLKCSNDEEIERILRKITKDVGCKFSLQPVMKKINHCFSAETMEEILCRLEMDNSQWSDNTLKALRKVSPTSLKITLKVLQLGRKLTLRECLQMEYRIAVRCLSNKDFYEGVRACLIDKDYQPKWSPATVHAVSDQQVDSYFAKLPEEQELRNKLR